jgi:hypothetical protein
MASTTTDADLSKEYDAVQSIWKQQDDHVAASRAARVPLPKKNIGVRRGSPTPREGDGTKEPDSKRRVASPTVRNTGRSLDLSGLPGTPIKPDQVKPAPRGGSANKSLFEPPELPERKPSFEALDSSMLGEGNLPELHEDDEKWLEQTFINEESMDVITDWKHGEMSLFEILTREELDANEIMNRMDSGDLSREEGEKMIRLIVRDLNLAGRQATLQSDILKHYLDKPCKMPTSLKIIGPKKKELTNHIKIKF